VRYVLPTSAYGFSSWMEKSDAVAAWNLAAAEVLPILPGTNYSACRWQVTTQNAGGSAPQS